MEILTEQKLCRKGLHWYPVTDKTCRECRNIASRKLYLANREHLREKKREWYQANRERVCELNKKWRRANPELKLKADNRWRQANPERVRKKGREWWRANPDTVNAMKARRRAVKKKALASWAGIRAIKNFYTEARRLTKSTGVKHHVDHIYPLQSEYMCGLHVETNLQILTEKENILKGNRTWPGQLECQKGSVYARFPKELTDLLNDQQT
jgi:hypothetical protein